MTPGKRLAAAGVVIVGVTTYMAYVGASASWQYYVTAEECLDHAASFVGRRVRVSGKVVAGSLRIAPDRKTATFALGGRGLTGGQKRLRVICSGLLPDNLSEGGDVVVEGRLESGALLHGDKVLTACASKYEARPANIGPPNQPASDPAGQPKEAT